MSAQEVWARLHAGGLVEGDLPERGAAASPWYVRVMLGIAGWIGALFLLGFVGAAFAFVFRSAGAALVGGAGCCAAAFALFRTFKDQDFADQFALALSLAGQVLLIVGLGQYLKPDDPGLYFAVAAVQAGIALAVPNFLHRLLTACGAAVALSLGILQLSLHGLAAPLLCAALAFIWLEPARWARGGRLWRPVGYGLVLALLLIETFRLFGAQRLFGFGGELSGWTASWGPLIGRGISAALLVWAAIVLALRDGHEAGGRAFAAVVGGAVLAGLVSLTAPGLAAALLILLLGFAAGNRLLMGLGVLSLLGFVAHYYYSLHATLLEKSGIMALTGLCLLAVHLVLRRGASGAEEPGHG